MQGPRGLGRTPSLPSGGNHESPDTRAGTEQWASAWPGTGAPGAFARSGPAPSTNQAPRAVADETSADGDVDEYEHARITSYRRSVFVSDLRHFMGMPEDAPGPAVRMAEQLTAIVRAATAGPAGLAWVSALGCRRRPGRRPCEGRMVVFRADLPAPIEWRCDVCGDEGVISGWEDSYADLRPPRDERSRSAKPEVWVADEVMAALRDLRLLDTDCERMVFAARADPEGPGALLDVDADDLDELIGFVAAEANHEVEGRRQKRLDNAFIVLSGALEALEER